MGQTQFYGYGTAGYGVLIDAKIRRQEVPLDADTTLALGYFNEHKGESSGTIKYQALGKDLKGAYEFSIKLVQIAPGYSVGIYETGNGDIKHRLNNIDDNAALGVLVNKQIDVALIRNRDNKRLNYFPDSL